MALLHYPVIRVPTQMGNISRIPGASRPRPNPLHAERARSKTLHAAEMQQMRQGEEVLLLKSNGVSVFSDN